MTVYIDDATYRRQKGALTRAINSNDPEKVVAAVEKVLIEWRGKAWPDSWHRWNIALDDAYFDLSRSDMQYDSFEKYESLMARFEYCSAILNR